MKALLMISIFAVGVAVVIAVHLGIVSYDSHSTFQQVGNINVLAGVFDG